MGTAPMEGPNMSAPRGIFASEYSAMTQSAIMRAPFGRTEYIGQLRLDVLLAGRLVVPDSQLLDGRFFLETGPDELRRQVSIGPQHPLPLRIRPRRGTLEETLAVWLERRGSEYLNGFPFNAIRSDDARAALADALTQTKAEALRARLSGQPSIPKALALFLRDLLRARGFDADDDVAVLERGWSLWVEEDRAGRLKIEAWDRAFDLQTAMALDPVDPEQDLATDKGRELYMKLSRMEFRSDATALIRRLKDEEDAPSDLLDVDVETLLAWYTDARHRAFAMQHGCDFARAERLDGVPVGPVRRALLRAVQGDRQAAPAFHDLPPALMEALTTMAPDRFEEVVTAVRDPLLAWWHSGDPDALARLVEAMDTRVSVKATDASPAMAHLFAKVTATAVGLAVGGALWAVVAALLSDGILAGREKLAEAGRRAARARVVEYGLERVSALHQ